MGQAAFDSYCNDPMIANLLSLPKIKSVRIDGAAHQGQAALRCAQRAE
jgi:hypothetical protein